MTAIVGLALALLPYSAQAAQEKIEKGDFLRFINCPTVTEVSPGAPPPVAPGCTYDETLSGEFKMGTKNVPITNPVIMQGGVAELNDFTEKPASLIAPRFNVPALSPTSQPIPGGLTGVTEILGGPASATAELAGPVSGITFTPVNLLSTEGIAVELPIKVHLENELLGPNCYIGSDSEPVVLKLTDGENGSRGEPEGHDRGRITEFKGITLVDNKFAVPAAKGCGTSALEEPIITELVNVAAGLPSGEGKNSAELTGNLYISFASWVAKYDKGAIAKKEKELAGGKKGK
ncbi:MAG TPA: hypothetical protein VMA86_03350 [Acetobacteraceae bacterium]|nr:hypothetical protein [Acetobacteraceae bacterium]